MPNQDGLDRAARHLGAPTIELRSPSIISIDKEIAERHWAGQILSLVINDLYVPPCDLAPGKYSLDIRRLPGHRRPVTYEEVLEFCCQDGYSIIGARLGIKLCLADVFREYIDPRGNSKVLFPDMPERLYMGEHSQLRMVVAELRRGTWKFLMKPAEEAASYKDAIIVRACPNQDV